MLLSFQLLNWSLFLSTFFVIYCCLPTSPKYHWYHLTPWLRSYIVLCFSIFLVLNVLQHLNSCQCLLLCTTPPDSSLIWPEGSYSCCLPPNFHTPSHLHAFHPVTLLWESPFFYLNTAYLYGLDSVLINYSIKIFLFWENLPSYIKLLLHMFRTYFNIIYMYICYIYAIHMTYI